MVVAASFVVGLGRKRRSFDELLVVLCYVSFVSCEVPSFVCFEEPFEAFVALQVAWKSFHIRTVAAFDLDETFLSCSLCRICENK